MEKDQLFVIVHIVEDALESIKHASFGNELQVPSIQIDNFSELDLISMVVKSEQENTQSFLFKVHAEADLSKLNPIFGHIARRKCKVYVQGSSASLEASLNKFRIQFSSINTPEDLLI